MKEGQSFTHVPESNKRHVEYGVIPEYRELSLITQNIIKELGPKEFLKIIFGPSRYATVGDSVWAIFSDVFVTNNGNKAKSLDDELRFKLQLNKKFQIVVAERMGLPLLFENRQHPIGSRSLSEALEGLIGAIWYKRGGKKALLPFDIAQAMMDLLSDEEKTQKEFRSDEEEILYYYPDGKIKITKVPGTKRWKAELIENNEVVVSVERRGEARSLTALAAAIRELHGS